MKYLKQLVIILLFSFLGELLQELRDVARRRGGWLFAGFLALTVMALGAAVPDPWFRMYFSRALPGVNILSHWGILAPEIVPIITVVLLSTVIVLAVSGLVTKLLLGKGGKENG